MIASHAWTFIGDALSGLAYFALIFGVPALGIRWQDRRRARARAARRA